MRVHPSRILFTSIFIPKPVGLKPIKNTFAFFLLLNYFVSLLARVHPLRKMTNECSSFRQYCKTVEQTLNESQQKKIHRQWNKFVLLVEVEGC